MCEKAVKHSSVNAIGSTLSYIKKRKKEKKKTKFYPDTAGSLQVLRGERSYCLYSDDHTRRRVHDMYTDTAGNLQLLKEGQSCSPYPDDATCRGAWVVHNMYTAPTGVMCLQVLRGGQKDLDVQIITPNGMVLYEKQRANKDEVTFTPQNGEFRFCFSNEFSQLTDKVGSQRK